MSRQRFEPAALFQTIAGLALEAVTARESSDDPEDLELIEHYRDALFQFDGFEHQLTAYSTERTIAQCSENSDYLWDSYLETLAAEATATFGIVVPEGCGSALVLKTLGLHFGVDLTTSVKDIDFDGVVSIDNLVTLALLLPDGHNLKGCALQGAWYCDRPRLWEFGGWCSMQSPHYAIERSSAWDLAFARRLSAVLDHDPQPAPEVLYNHLEPYFSGIADPQVRGDLALQVGRRLCRLGLTQNNEAGSPPASAAVLDADAGWTRTVYVGAHACDEYGEGPSYARLEVTPAFIATLLSLQALCVKHELSEVRVFGGPDDWGPAGVVEELRLNCPKLVVTDSLFWFRDRPKHASYVVESESQWIDSFLAAVSGAGEPVYLDIKKADIEALEADDENADKAIEEASSGQ